MSLEFVKFQQEIADDVPTWFEEKKTLAAFRPPAQKPREHVFIQVLHVDFFFSYGYLLSFYCGCAYQLIMAK